MREEEVYFQLHSIIPNLMFLLKTLYYMLIISGARSRKHGTKVSKTEGFVGSKINIYMAILLFDKILNHNNN